MKVLLGIHNLSVYKDRKVRTGIQEVLFRLWKWLCVDHPIAGVDVLPIPYIPTENFENVPNFLAATEQASPFIVFETLKELGLSVKEAVERWPYLSVFLDDSASSAAKCATFLEIAETSDIYFEASLCETRHLHRHLRKLNPKIRVGQMVYDFGPVVRPEYVVGPMVRWFSDQYVDSLRRCDFTIAISRHTAIDQINLESDAENSANQTYYATLPTHWDSDAARSVRPKSSEALGDCPFFFALSTLEPRKNFDGLLRGYLRYLEMTPPSSAAKLALAGSPGWKNEELLSLISSAEKRGDVIRLGYVSEDDLPWYFKNALALLMPSHYEGFGVPIAIANAYGTRVLTAANSSLPEVANWKSSSFVSLMSDDELAFALAGLSREAQWKGNERVQLVTPRQYTGMLGEIFRQELGI